MNLRSPRPVRGPGENDLTNELRVAPRRGVVTTEVVSSH
jgi:hypothetical protein